ncbi:MAG: cobalamin biosynthesis protein [Roseiarcus sp.]
MIAIGIGCRSGAAKETILTIVRDVLARVQTPGETARLFSIDRKRGEPGLIAAAQDLGMPLDFLTSEMLRTVEDQVVTRSRRAEAELGIASVSEAAALVGAGLDARLVAPRVAAAGVTCAIARGSGR